MINITDLVEVTLAEKDDFLKVRETLTRIGVASKKDKTLFQSCHILHKKGLYYVVHFKELFALDGKPTDITENDLSRRNAIVNLLEGWALRNKIEKDEGNNEMSVAEKANMQPLSYFQDILKSYDLNKVIEI